MERAYAQALLRSVEAGKTPHAAVKAMREALDRSGRTALLPRIARAFARLAERESRKNDVVLTVAREKDERSAKAAAKDVLVALKAEMPELANVTDLKTQVDDTIIGGWRLEGRGVLVDDSYKSRLLEIYNRVTN